MSDARSVWCQDRLAVRSTPAMDRAAGRAATGRLRGPPRITWWIWVHGGTTDLDNFIFLCQRHHWMVHEGRWQLVRSDDGRMLAIPPTVRFGPSARDGTDYDSSS